MKDFDYISKVRGHNISKLEIECYSKQLIKNIFDITSYTKVRKEVFISTMRPFIPYCLHKIDENTFLPLNRDYKPIGMPPGKHYKYEDYKFLFLEKDEINLNILWDNGFSFGGYGYFLYSDACTPYTHLMRYFDILSESIFLQKTDKRFIDFWNYKMTHDKDGWKRNESKLY